MLKNGLFVDSETEKWDFAVLMEFHEDIVSFGGNV